MSKNVIVSEQRRSKRLIDRTLNIEISLTIPTGKRIIKPVLDVNNKGLSFLLSASEGYFTKDTIIENVKMFNNKYEEFIPKTKVAYFIKNFKEQNGAKFNKIGLEFIPKDEKDKIILTRRSKRFSKDIFEKLKMKLFFLNEEKRECLGSIVDLSKQGICFKTKKNFLVPTKSSVISNLRIVVNDKTVYKGKVLIVDIEETRNDFVLRTKIMGRKIQLNKVFSLRLKSRIEQDKELFEKIFKSKTKISKEFKIIISDIIYFLNNTKETLDIFEKEIDINDFAMNKTKLRNNMFAMLEEKIYLEMDKQTNRLDKILNGLSVNEHEIYKNYFQKNLHTLLLHAPILRRIYTKPLGFSGDYAVMNMIYRNAYEGDSLFAKFMHKYMCYKPPSVANRNRVNYMYNKLKILSKNHKQLKITNIACGSALAIGEFIRKDKSSNNANITLLDFCEEALFYAKGELEKIIKENKRKTKLKFINESIFDIIRKKEVLNKINDEQDFIYSIGLFEYLNKSTCNILLKLLYSKLSKNGVLIIGNYNKKSPLKSWMELGVEWYLIYRDDKELCRLADKIDSKTIKIEKEPLELISFLNILKT